MLNVDILRQVDSIADALKARGIRLDAAYRRRDVLEPGRLVKEALEERLGKAVRKLFLQQRRVVLAAAEASGRSGLVASVGALDLGDATAEASMLVTLHQAGEHAIELFAAEATIGLDLTVYRGLAAAQVREHIGQLITQINATTLEEVRKALQEYVERPGMTLGDLADRLPFDGRRAQMVARTEITQTYGEIQKRAGEKLAAEYPDVVVEETWHTNRDDLVCPICGGLDGVVRTPGQPFVNKETGADVWGLDETHPECRCWTTVRTRINRQKQG